MSGPTRGDYTLRCGSCQAVVYSSDSGPPPDPRAVLVRFADTRCPRGGADGGCPNTTPVVVEQEERRPVRMRQWLTTLQGLIDTAQQQINELQELGDFLRPIGQGADAEHQELRATDSALAARIEQIAARVEQVAATHSAQIATHDGQIATHDGQIRTHDGQIATLVGQVDALAARSPVVRVSRAQSLASMALSSTRSMTFTWPTPMPTATYDVTLADERLTIASITSKTAAATTVTLRATATIGATTISAVAVGWSA